MNALNRDLKKLVNIIEKSESERVNKDYWRLKFHLMPPVGWLNDPNGLCEFNGEYHIFYQYSPFDENGGVKLWGHYTSKDFINYKNKGTDVFADQPYDCHGAYSGSTMVHDGKMNIFYTGNVKHIGDYDYISSGRGHNTVLLVSEDGKTFTNKKLLMTNKDYPENMSCHVRDPKVWRANDKFYMVQGARDNKDIGQVLVFESEDMINWTVINIIKSDEKFGYMWECPDLFKIDGKNILLISPQGIEPEGIKYNNIYQSGYYLIEGDYKTNNYSLSNFEEMDRGFDFYAPQTFDDSKGRRILIGWMGLPDIEELYSNPTTEYGWQHALTVPRELKIKNNKLIQRPIEELDKLRKESKELQLDSKINEQVFDTFDMVINFEECDKLESIIKDCAKLSYNKNNKLFTLSFIDGGYGRDSRSVKLEKLDNLRVLCDTSSLEIFINGGEEVFTTRFYPNKENLGIKVDGDNLEGTLWVYEMEAFNIEN
ncbi:MAG: glycoside hydrolase family 32 protein [Peptostreptococcaceae bacterium]